MSTHIADIADDFVHALLPSDRAAEVERHCAECETCRAAVEEARRRLAALKAVPPVEVPSAVVDATVRAVDEKVRTTQRRIRRVFKWLAASAAAAALVLGVLSVYYLNLAPSPYDLIVLGQSELLSDSMAALRVRIVDRKTNQPVPDVPVSMRLREVQAHRGDYHETHDLPALTTGAQGLAQALFHVPATAVGDFDLIVTADTPGAPEVVTQRVHLRRSVRLLLTSDKPVYQPGQTIHMRSLALWQATGKPVAGEMAAITVTDSRGNIIFKHEDKTSGYGIIAADCVLADEIGEGAYTLGCRVGDTESRLRVSVNKYVLPKFKLGVEFDRPFYAPTDTAKCTIRADYFFGKPVADAEVRVEVRRKGEMLPPDTIPPLRTGPNGEAKFETPLADLLDEDSDANETPLSFRVTVTDAAGQKQTSDVERLVTRRPVRIEVIPEGGTLVRGLDNTIYFLTTTPDGRPVPARLGISGDAGGLIRTNELGLGTYVASMHRDKGLDLTVEALDADDEVIAEKKVRLDMDSSPNDFLLTTDRAVYQAGETMHIRVIADHSKQPSHPQTGMVLIPSVTLDVFKTDGVRLTLVSHTIAFDKGGKGPDWGDLDIDLAPEMSGTLVLSATRYGENGEEIHKSRLVYVRPADQLRLKMTPISGAKEYRPRDYEKVRMTLTGPDGKPAVGAIGVAGVDEAVFSVPEAADRATPLDGVDRELLRPVYALYPSWSPDLDRRLGKDNANALELALFSATAREDVETFSLGGESYEQKFWDNELRREAWRNGLRRCWLAVIVAVSTLAFLAVSWFVSSIAVRCFLLGVLVVTAPITLIAFAVLLPHTDLMGDAMRSERITPNKVYSPVDSRVERYKVIDESGSMEWRLIAKQRSRSMFGLSALRAESDETLPREQFPETLLWRPQVITDENGVADVDFTFADSITTWRLSASAVDGSGRLGAATLPLRVVRPFFVDFNLPVSLTRNDEVTVPVVVHNHTDKPQTVALKLSDADWFTLQGVPEKPLVVEAGKVAAAHYRLTAKRAGTFTLEVRAEGQGVADALKRSIDIAPDGIRQEHVVNGSLDRPATIPLTVPDKAIDGSVHAVVKLYPSSFSQLLEGLDGILRLPSGCFEQTSSSLYPNVLALDYLHRTGQDSPDVVRKAKRYIHTGYQRLLTFEASGGGFEWFGHSPASRTLTAYGLMEFTDMARVHDVDPALIDRTRRWLLAQRKIDGSWQPDGHGAGSDSRLAATAYIAWSVFDNGGAADQAKLTLDYLLARKPEKLDDPYTLALVANALLSLDTTGEKAAAYLDRLETLKKTDGGRFGWWQRSTGERTVFYGAGAGADVETTALAALALLRARRTGPAASPLAWIASRKDAHGTWGSTQATVLSLKALLAGTPTTGRPWAANRVIEIKLGDTVLETRTIPPEQAEVMQQIAIPPALLTGTKTLTLTETTGSATGYQVAWRYNVESTKPGPASGFFDIDLKHDRTAVDLLGVIGVKARVVNRKPAPAAMVMLDLPVPPGFVPLTDDIEALQRDSRVAKFAVEPGKIVVYLRELRRDRPLEVRYGLQAVQSVKAVSPGARVWEYYAPERAATTTPVVLVVK